MNDTSPAMVMDIELPKGIAELIAMKQLVDKAFREIMKEGTHYGQIPGCGEDKPSLLQPGAQLLNFMFGFTVPELDIEYRDLPDFHLECIIKSKVLDKNGRIRAIGVGSASTLEAKHRWRYAEPENTGRLVPKEYWAAKKAERMDEMEEILGGKQFIVKKLEGGWYICKRSDSKIENPDIADIRNTVLKMAKKRSYVQGAIEATASSDIFTQDLEDIPPEQVQTGGDSNGNRKREETPKKAQKQAKTEAPEIDRENCYAYDIEAAKAKVKVEDGKRIVNEVFKNQAGLIEDNVLLCRYRIPGWSEFLIAEPESPLGDDDIPSEYQNIPGLD